MDSKLMKKSEQFFSKFPELRLKKGELILEPERDIKNTFYLKKGYVRTFVISNQGTELTMHIFVPGSCFPMTDTLAGIKNQFFFETLTPVELNTIPKTKVVNFVQKEHDVLLDLTKRLLLGLDKLLIRIERLVFAKAEERVVSTLLFLARHFGEIDKSAVKLKYLFTHKDIAAFAGISRETASREMESLVKRGLISYQKHLIKLKDRESLKNLANM